MANYTAQIKHLRENYKALRVDLRKADFEKFKEVCKANGTTGATEIKKFDAEYIEKNS